MTGDFEIRMDWHRSTGLSISAEEYAFGRLTVRCGNDMVSRVYDEWHRCATDGPYVSILPLAEWLVGNWWSLLYEPIRHTKSHRSRHSWLAGAGPYSIPDLEMNRDGENIEIVATPHTPRYHEATFPVSGRWLLSAPIVVAELTRFLDGLSQRLTGFGEANVRFVSAWEHLRGLDVEEREYCTACGVLGLDPDALSEDEAQAILDAFSHPCFSDRDLWFQFLEAEPGAESTRADAERFTKCLQYVETLPEAAERVAQWRAALHGPPRETPHARGYRHARELRQKLGLSPNTSPDLEQLFDWNAGQNSTELPAAGVALLSAGVNNLPRIGVRPGARGSARFAFCRALHSYLTDPRPVRYVAQTHDSAARSGRAFASEFLLPADLLAERVSGPYVSTEEVESLAIHFDVSTELVSRQLHNHCLAEVVA